MKPETIATLRPTAYPLGSAMTIGGMPKVLVGLLFSTCLFAQNYTRVFLDVSAPEAWRNDVAEALTVKLNAIPDVQVVVKETDSAFTIAVHLNAVTDRNDETIGYSMMALIYGTYDSKMLEAIFETIDTGSNDKDLKASVELMKYLVSGNVFLAATVHTHGPLNDIDSAYDEIVGKLKTNALPEFRRLGNMLNDSDTGGKASLDEGEVSKNGRPRYSL